MQPGGVAAHAVVNGGILGSLAPVPFTFSRGATLAAGIALDGSQSVSARASYGQSRDRAVRRERFPRFQTRLRLRLPFPFGSPTLSLPNVVATWFGSR